MCPGSQPVFTDLGMPSALGELSCSQVVLGNSSGTGQPCGCLPSCSGSPVQGLGEAGLSRS